MNSSFLLTESSSSRTEMVDSRFKDNIAIQAPRPRYTTKMYPNVVAYTPLDLSIQSDLDFDSDAIALFAPTSDVRYKL